MRLISLATRISGSVASTVDGLCVRHISRRISSGKGRSCKLDIDRAIGEHRKDPYPFQKGVDKAEHNLAARFVASLARFQYIQVIFQLLKVLRGMFCSYSGVVLEKPILRGKRARLRYRDIEQIAFDGVQWGW